MINQQLQLVVPSSITYHTPSSNSSKQVIQSGFHAQKVTKSLCLGNPSFDITQQQLQKDMNLLQITPYSLTNRSSLSPIRYPLTPKLSALSPIRSSLKIDVQQTNSQPPSSSHFSTTKNISQDSAKAIENKESLNTPSKQGNQIPSQEHGSNRSFLKVNYQEMPLNIGFNITPKKCHTLFKHEQGDFHTTYKVAKNYQNLRSDSQNVSRRVSGNVSLYNKRENSAATEIRKNFSNDTSRRQSTNKTMTFNLFKEEEIKRISPCFKVIEREDVTLARKLDQILRRGEKKKPKREKVALERFVVQELQDESLYQTNDDNDDTRVSEVFSRIKRKILQQQDFQFKIEDKSELFQHKQTSMVQPNNQFNQSFMKNQNNNLIDPFSYYSQHCIQSTDYGSDNRPFSKRRTSSKTKNNFYERFNQKLNESKQKEKQSPFNNSNATYLMPQQIVPATQCEQLVATFVNKSIMLEDKNYQTKHEMSNQQNHLQYIDERIIHKRQNTSSSFRSFLSSNKGINKTQSPIKQ